MRVAFLSVLSIVAVVGLGACCRSLDGGRTTISPNVLAYAAQKTHARYMRAVNAGEEVRSDVIPKRYWTSAIRALKPIRVYTHRAHIVVAQRIREHMEEGKYICVLISSFAPQDGVDGFSLQPNLRTGNTYMFGNGVFDYRRPSDMIDLKGDSGP